MENQIANSLITDVSFGLLFVWLLWDTRKESREREKESKRREDKLYEVIAENQETISILADKFKVVEDIKEDVEEIKLKFIKEE